MIDFKVKELGFIALAILMISMYIQSVAATNFDNDMSVGVGDTWDLGNGFAIFAQSIDANATPKQVWLTLYDSGVKLDEKVLREGDEWNVYDKNNHLIFSTTVVQIFPGPSTDLVTLDGTFTERGLKAEDILYEGEGPIIPTPLTTYSISGTPSVQTATPPGSQVESENYLSGFRDMLLDTRIIVAIITAIAMIISALITRK